MIYMISFFYEKDFNVLAFVLLAYSDESEEYYDQLSEEELHLDRRNKTSKLL